MPGPTGMEGMLMKNSRQPDSQIILASLDKRWVFSLHSRSSGGQARGRRRHWGVIRLRQ
jgi:hypothetical protein